MAMGPPLTQVIDALAPLLPAQGPISIFIHNPFVYENQAGAIFHQ